MAEGTRHDTTALHTDAAPDMYEEALPEELKESYRTASDGVDMGREIRIMRVLLRTLLPDIHLPATRVFILRAVIALGRIITAQIRALGKHSDNEELLQLLGDEEVTKQESEKNR